MLEDSVKTCRGNKTAKKESTSLLFGELLGLVPHLDGVEEVGGDLYVAGCHLVDALRDGNGGAGALAGAAGGVAARAARRKLGRDRRRHSRRFAVGRTRRRRSEYA